MWKSQAPWKKSPPYFPATSALEAEFFSSPPLFENLKGGSTPSPSGKGGVGGGGAHYATVYENCAVYAKDKLPLLSSTFKAFAPPPPPPGPCMILSKKELVMKYLIELPDLVSVLTEEETKLFEIGVRNMIIDNTLPAAIADNGDDVDIVKWYSHPSKKYPAVHKMDMLVLSIFHGPKVESRFSAMGGLISKKANWMCDHIYSTIQTVKYSM